MAPKKIFLITVFLVAKIVTGQQIQFSCRVKYFEISTFKANLEKIIPLKSRVYFDTSVIGGYFDDEFSHWSKKLVEQILGGEVL